MLRGTTGTFSELYIAVDLLTYAKYFSQIGIIRMLNRIVPKTEFNLEICKQRKAQGNG